MNKVMLMGNVGNEVNLRFSTKGTAVANFSVATNERFTDKQGVKQERTEWHRIVVWGAQAENCAKYLQKGSRVLIEGTLRYRTWEGKDNVKHYATDIHAMRVQFLSSKKVDNAVVPESHQDEPDTSALDLPL